MLPKDGQAKMEFPYLFSVKEMGGFLEIESKPHTVFLSDWFIREKIGASMFDADPFFRKIAKTTNVICPFCQKGSLKINSVEPKYSGGPHSLPLIMHHVGNEYEYICSNSECDGVFIGSVTWMHID